MTASSFPYLDDTEFLENLYVQYLSNPDNVPCAWQEFFRTLDEPKAGDSSFLANGDAQYLANLASKQAGVQQLINAYRYRAYWQADLDPLKLHESTPVLDLALDFHGLEGRDLSRTFNTGTLFAPAELPLHEIIAILRDTYCQSIGVELTHLISNGQKRWFQERLESNRGRASLSAKKKRDILKWLTASGELEKYLHRKYVGQKRFSLEGNDSLIPLLDELIQLSGDYSVREMVIGMAHRGRLNVLVNILGKHPKILFSEFEGTTDASSGSGDVKYHLGFSSDIQTPGGSIHLSLAFNPSHLEIINPVVEGSVRARQERRNDEKRNQVMPVLIHGDAAFSGQGVVSETLNLAETRGFSTGGTVHIIVNNQIGFTTSDPRDSRSTSYCTDVAKLVQAPILHVNGDDPEAVIFVTRIALKYRMKFHKDVVIDLIGYRRHGHNEADEPMVTQPIMYQAIGKRQTIQSLYAKQLEEEGVIQPDEAARFEQDYLASLETNKVVSRSVLSNGSFSDLVDWSPYIGIHWRAPVNAQVSLETIERLGTRLCQYPSHFRLHRVVTRMLEGRGEMALGRRPMDWGFAESLSYATLLEAGYSVRLSGQDSERGTFSHRHATLHNQNERGVYQPLANLFPEQPRFRVINSLLSEEAVLAFEFGYSSSSPESLVIWEAQFGDFANGAQVIIDQFLSSSEAKWSRQSGLTLLLPHGYEGAGPEHSSARLERFLQLCAEDNIQVCVPSSPAQIFHLLRRQMLRPYRKPLIVMSPKSLLRHRLAISTREELLSNGYQILIDEVDELAPERVTRLVLCSGKIYYDLLEKRRENHLDHIAIVRLEQLYPFPREEIGVILEKYNRAHDIVWAQEEPRNQGSWFFMLSRRHLAGSIEAHHTLHYAGRLYSASPAAGYSNTHLRERDTVVQDALGVVPQKSLSSIAIN